MLKRITKSILAIAIIISMSNLCINSTYAFSLFGGQENTEKSIGSLDSMTKNEMYDTFKNITTAIVTRDETRLYEYSKYFSTQTMEQLVDYSKTLRADDLPTDFCIDYTGPSYSSTGDTVILVNFKIWSSDATTNTVYLYEFHINDSAQIYGYQIWVY